MKILSIGLDKSILDKNSKLAKRAVDYGNQVGIYTAIVPAKKNEEIDFSGRVKIFGLKNSFKPLVLLRIFIKANSILSRGNYDLLTIQDQYYLALIGYFLARKNKIALELQVHGTEKLSGFRKAISHFVLPRADMVRTVSQRMKKKIIEEYCIKEEKLAVIPIYSENNFDFFRPKEGGGVFVFLTASRLVPVKNLGLLINAFADLIKDKKNMELRIVGNGEEKENLVQKVKNLGLENSIIFIDWQSNLQEQFSQSDCFVLVSDSEGWGMTVIEAAAFGLPIIMTDVGCAGEVIKNGESGLVIPVGNKGRLVESMREISSKEDLRKKLGKNAKLAIKNLPGKEETLKMYKIFWERAIKNAKLKYEIRNK